MGLRISGLSALCESHGWIRSQGHFEEFGLKPSICGPHWKLMEREIFIFMPLFYEYSGVLCNFHFNSFDLGAHGRSEKFRKVLGNLRLKTIVVKILTDKSSNKTYIQKVSALLETILLSRHKHSQCQEESTFILCSCKKRMSLELRVYSLASKTSF